MGNSSYKYCHHIKFIHSAYTEKLKTNHLTKQLILAEILETGENIKNSSKAKSNNQQSTLKIRKWSNTVTIMYLIMQQMLI